MSRIKVRVSTRKSDVLEFCWLWLLQGVRIPPPKKCIFKVAPYVLYYGFSCVSQNFLV